MSDVFFALRTKASYFTVHFGLNSAYYFLFEATAFSITKSRILSKRV